MLRGCREISVARRDDEDSTSSTARRSNDAMIILQQPLRHGQRQPCRLIDRMPDRADHRIPYLLDGYRDQTGQGVGKALRHLLDRIQKILACVRR